MKTKKFQKKLTFNKQTIAHLGNVEINDVLAGKGEDTIPVTYPLTSCQGCPTYTCIPSNCTGLNCC